MEDDIAWLGGWEGWRVARVERRAGACPEVWIHRSPVADAPPICDGCGGAAREVHEIEVRELPILDARTWLWVPRRWVSCRRCGPKLERLSWLSRYARVTKRLAESVARFCRSNMWRRSSATGTDAVKAIDKRYLKETPGRIDLSGVSMIAMDEFAIHKGHRYATVIVDPMIKKVPWVERGRGVRISALSSSCWAAPVATGSRPSSWT